MITINLKEFFYWYTSDEYIEVTEEVAMELRGGKLYEQSYQRRITRNKAQYSLDCNDGIECAVNLPARTPQELLEHKELFFHLWNALNSLPELQGRRIDACIILGESYRAIARREGVSKNAVHQSVQYGLIEMKKYLKEFF